MGSHANRLRPHASVLSRFFGLFRATGHVVDPGQTLDRATLRAVRDLSPHLLKDIGAYDY